jgi:beta-galactosidase
VNAAELWPNPDLVRGNANDRALIARVADEKGLPLMVGVSEPTGMFDPADPSVSAGQFEAWQSVMQAGWKRLRNSPSAVILLVSGNRFAHPDDQNPLRVGNRRNLDFDPVWKRTKSDPGWKVINAVKSLDPTRPVTSHHNSNVGDFQTCNNYLNLHPLQEREDWLSVWAKSGDIPFSAVEFDPPFAATLNRGRKGFSGESTTEPWLTEHLAIYQGADAYAREEAPYRAMIARTLVSGQDYKGVNIPSASAFRKFTAWWMTRTLRAWRGYGLSGGMIHWANAYGWKNRDEADDSHKFPPFQAGSRGAYTARLINRAVFSSLSSEVADTTESGKALIAGYSPTLSWIAGPADSFTRQDHIFYPGEKIAKSAALLNDTATSQPYTVEWTAEAGGKPVGGGKASGEVPVGVPAFAPIEFAAPEAEAKTDGTIRLKTTLGDAVHEDVFVFRVVPKPGPPVSKSPLHVYDPEGTTTAWLQSLGAGIAPVNSPGLALPRSGVLVIGRNAIPKTSAAEWPVLRVQIEKFVQGGGRVLLMAQDPEWMRQMSGLRFARHVGRRFWPVWTGRISATGAGRVRWLTRLPRWRLTARCPLSPDGAGI